MKLNAYEKMLRMGKEKVGELLAKPRAIEMRHKANHEISSLDVKIAEQQNNIEEIGSVYPIDFNKLIHAMDALGLAERRKAQLQKIVAEMFP
jgi:hypothetical protein